MQYMEVTGERRRIHPCNAEGNNYFFTYRASTFKSASCLKSHITPCIYTLLCSHLFIIIYIKVQLVRQYNFRLFALLQVFKCAYILLLN